MQPCFADAWPAWNQGRRPGRPNCTPLEEHTMVKSEALMQEGKIFLGRSVEPEYLELKLANRHGLVAAAAGTARTVTLQVLAEAVSGAGVPVFAADIKGDLSGIS